MIVHSRPVGHVIVILHLLVGNVIDDRALKTRAVDVSVASLPGTANMNTIILLLLLLNLNLKLILTLKLKGYRVLPIIIRTRDGA